ncbi:MAG: hypothetical protein VX498_05770 [Myxococcota bacterium]|nr:hypothetical protein [Myxococcota bacterium]
MKTARALCLLLAFLLSTAGCEGSLGIWGVNVPLPGADDDDDDGTPSGLDLSTFGGLEYLNIRWNPEQAEQGSVDCAEEFLSSGELSTDADQERCPSCDAIWTVELELDDDDRPCTGQGTGLDVPSFTTRQVGMEFTAGGGFLLYRGASEDSEELDPMGVGAFDGVHFTWSGVGDWEQEHPDAGFTLFFSGEGDF